MERHSAYGAALTGIVASLGFATWSLALSRGSIGIARDDDWSYLNVVSTWTETGQLQLNGWVHMMFLTQGSAATLVSNLFTLGEWILQFSTLLFGALGLLCIYLLSRRTVSPALSLIVVLATGLNPLLMHLSATFMTDIPAWSLSLVSLVIGIKAVVERSTVWLFLAALMSSVAFGVREYAAVPLFALLVWVVWSKYPKTFRLWALSIGIAAIGINSVAYLWRHSLPGSVETVVLTPIESLALFSRLLLTLALLLAPYAALGAVLFWSRRGSLLEALRTCWLGASIGVVAAAGISVLSSLQLAGNVIHPYGSSWTSVGDGVRSLPLWGFRGLIFVGVLSLVSLLALVGILVQRRIVARSWRILERPQVSTNFAGLYVFISVAVMAVYFVAIFVAGAPAFDRYLLLVVPLLGIVILWLATRSLKERISKWQKSAVAVILVVTGAFGVVITDGLNQVDGLRWQVASELVESGIPAYKIDGGDAWFRYHQKDAPGVAQVGSLENSIPGRTWWQTFFEGSTFCRMVAIESETDLQAMYGPALSTQEERTLLGTPFRVMVFPGPDPC